MFVGNIPQNYDKFLRPIIFEDYADVMVEKAIKITASDVLELAAGTGIVSRKLRYALPDNTHLTITDLNAPMIDFARNKFNASENVTFRTVDAMKTDLKSDQFDLLVCQFGAMFFPDKVHSYREALRILRPKGSYLLSTWGTREENPFAQIAHSVCERIFADNPPVFYTVPFSYADPDQVENDMLEAGFSTVEHETIDLKKSVLDWEAFAQGLVHGNPLIDEIHARGHKNEAEIVQTIESDLRNTFGNEPASMPLKIHIFRGEKS
jgi:ubiquinone/menaquinone biosynthesis C-methylase UbiE